MDLYSTSFTIPRAAGASNFVHDSATVTGALGSVDPARSQGPPPPPPPSSRPPVSEAPPSSFHGRLGSMRSRFPPSVKAFMPSAFGGKRTSDRIAEAVGHERSEAEADNEAAVSANLTSASEKAELSHASFDPTTGPKLPNPILANLDRSMAQISRDNRSTAATRSSLEFSSSASFSADSTAPSSALGVQNGGRGDGLPGQAPPPHQSHSDPASATHSASNSFSANVGIGHSQSSKDLLDAMQRLSIDVMSSHQCLVTFAPVQPEEPKVSTPLANPGFPRQLSFPSYGSSEQLPFPNSNGANGSGYPYQQYHPQPIGTPDSAFVVGGGGGDGLGFPGFNGSSLSLSGLNPSSGTAQNVLAQDALTSSNLKKRVPQYNFHLSGGYQQVMGARGAILRENPFKVRSSIKVPRADVLEASTGSSPGADPVKPEVRRRLDEISSMSGATVQAIATDIRGADLGYGLETERMAELVVSGPFESVELARVKVLVLLDELLGLHSETCEIDYKLHNIIGGRKRCVIQGIQEETGTNVYLPSPFSGVLSGGRNAPPPGRQNTIHITGEFFGVQRAREMLFQVSLHKSKCIISRDAAILPRKLDWMLTERLEELRSIMLDNGTFVAFPVIGSQASLISVFGDNRVNIERTIRSIMQLACQFYVASLWLLPVSFDVFMSPASLNPTQMAPILRHISNTSGAEVVFKSNCFEIHGLESEVRSSVSAILDLDVVKSFNFEVRFQIELANEHREFISGKKNGKINKVMKQCGVRIKFETFNDYNFLIDVSGNDRGGVLQGLGLLQEELPAEMSFHVPEAYHKRIIGVGGKNIQRIMKKYGVYVKFSNAEEFAALGGYLDNEDNVIARTPAKNAINLENLKQSVMELVNPKDKDYVTETVAISRRYHRTLLGEKAIFIHDIEAKTSSIVRFPPKESASDLVTIFGPESQIHIAAQMLLDHVPFEAEFRTPNSIELAQVLQTHEFVALAERLKRDLNIVVVPILRQRQGGEAVFKLRLNRSNSDFLPTAKDAIEDFLISRNINVYASPARARSDSFASAFPHFANKLLSTAAAAESSESFHAAAAAAAAAEQARVQHERRLRAAASTPDIKALFDGPSQHAPGLNYTTTAANSPLIASSLYPSPYGNGRGFGSDVWGAPRHFTSSSTSTAASIAPPIGTPGIQPSSGVQFPQHTPRLSDDLNPDHCGPEALGMEERVKALRKPRSFAHRAQSLDIGALAAQQSALGGATTTPATPYTLGAIGSGSVSSGSAGFPGLGGGGAGANGHHHHQQHHHHAPASSISRLPPASSQPPDPTTMDEVSRVLAQLAFDRS
ncbi:K y domain-containing protein 4 [Thecaphora frezii]